MTLEDIQEKIDYTFRDIRLLSSALKAAHRSDRDGIFDDGNRGLAKLGLDTMNMIEGYNIIVKENGIKKEVDTRGGWTKSKRDRANAFQSLGLDHYIDRSSRQQHEKPSSTVLANALCAIIGAVWLDLLRQNESAFNITEQISRILHRIGTVITGTTAGGAPMTDESNPGVLEDNDGVQGGTHSEERGFTTSNESFDPDIDLPDIFTHQGSIQDQNDALQSIHPTNTRFENIQPALTLPSFDQFQGTVYEQNVDMVSFDSIEVGNLRDGTRPPNTTEAIGNPGPRLQPESQIASTNQQIIPDMTKQANTTEASGKEKHSQGNEKMFRIVLLHNTLIYEELEKVNSLPAHLCGDLAPLLDHHQIAQLSTDEPQVLLLRLLYFTIGSCQSLLGFKDTLRIAREMPDYSIFASRRNLSDMERFDQICRLDKTEALCVLLKRCHIAILFEKEREYLLQNDSIVIETPLTIREGHRAEMGNPVAKHEAALTDMMLYKFKPELKKGTDEFKKYRGQVSRLRQLAKRLRILTSKFGFGILALLPSEPACPEFKLTDSMLRSISEKLFAAFSNILDEFQGPVLKELSKAVEPALEALVNGGLSSPNLFPIEFIDSDVLERLPKGSRGIFELLL